MDGDVCLGVCYFYFVVVVVFCLLYVVVVCVRLGDYVGLGCLCVYLFDVV